MIAEWSLDASSDQVALVLPDGCVDVLIERSTGGRMSLRVTELMPQPKVVQLAGGTGYRGFRLRPGASLPSRAVTELATLASRDPDAIGTQLDGFACLPLALADALQALRGSASVVEAARRAGVGVRTLQRVVQRHTGWSPDRWRRLGRARGAARTVVAGARLAEVAYTFGFSDQAHLTRELRRWLGTTPGRLRRGEAAAGLVRQRGYEPDATGEQISTRCPSRSAT